MDRQMPTRAVAEPIQVRPYYRQSLQPQGNLAPSIASDGSSCELQSTYQLTPVPAILNLSSDQIGRKTQSFANRLDSPNRIPFALHQGTICEPPGRIPT